jgi:predicted O-methyltransferase YrrM
MNITDEKILGYINGFYQPLNPFLKDLRAVAEKADIPIIQKEIEAFLLTLLEMNRPNRILEIGTAVGYSALCFAMARPGVHITTLELQERHRITAEANFLRAGVDKQIRVVQGDARDSLKILQEELKEGISKPFDFIFIDGAKSHYKEIWDLCMPLCKIDTVIVSDNILYKGIIAADEYLDHPRNKTIVKRMRAYLEHIMWIPEVTTSILPLGDGIAISVVNFPKQ